MCRNIFDFQMIKKFDTLTIDTYNYGNKCITDI